MAIKTAAQRQQEREAKKAARKAHYKSPPVADASQNCCLRNGEYILLAVNVTFGLLGAGLIGMGIYGTQGSFASILGTGPGLSLAGLGGVVLLVAIAGHLGAKYDNKFILLAYFLIVFAAMVTFAVLGGLVLFNNSEINATFSEYWCENPTTAADGQKEFDCCGYECPFDRPANGVCSLPDGSTVQPTGASIVTCNDGSNDDVIKQGKAVCANALDFQGLQGCKEKGLDEMQARVVPLFGLAFATGMALLVGTFISGYLVCRSTRGAGAGGADKDAVDANQAVPSDDPTQPLAGATTFALTVTDTGAGGAAESKA